MPVMPWPTPVAEVMVDKALMGLSPGPPSLTPGPLLRSILDPVGRQSGWRPDTGPHRLRVPETGLSRASHPAPHPLVPKVPARNVPADTWPQREGLGGEQSRLC